MTLRETERARSFGSIARDYDRLRSRPPIAAVDWLVGTEVRTAVELGAGTGIFSRILAERVQELRAIEPDERMREIFQAASPNIQVFAGTAEEIPVEDSSVDGVFCSESWHWFDPSRTFAEIARVLRPGGRLGIIGNSPDRTVPWMDEMFSPIVTAHAATRVPGRFSLSDGPESGPFTPPERYEVTWTRPLAPADIIALFGTYSPVLTMTEDEREAFYARCRELLASHPDLAGRDVIDLPFRTTCWLTRYQPTVTHP